MGKTITEKIFESHVVDEPFSGTKVLSLDVVMCHEITTPIAITDLQARGKDRVFDALKIKAVIDHVTPPKDSKSATQAKILREWAFRQRNQGFFRHRNKRRVPCLVPRKRVHQAGIHGHHGRQPHLYPRSIWRICRGRGHHGPGSRHSQRRVRIPSAAQHSH